MSTVIQGWQLIGQRNGKPHYRYTKNDHWYSGPARSLKTTAHPVTRTHEYKALPTLTMEQAMNLKPGDACPKCRGSGIYRWHDSSRRRVGSSTCYWCNDARTGGNRRGKGWIDQRDLVYIFGAAAEGRLNLTISA